ncbi:MAG: hypothetical protein K9M07_00785 [Simkaniaceae bacterium]|nr:hypothetical protein [Simkaniaceae bacterium]
MTQNKQVILQAALEKIGKSVKETGSMDPQDLSAEDASLLYTIGHNLYGVGDYERAKPLFHKLVIARPLEGRNWFGLAATLQQMREYENALVAWYMTIMFQENDPLPHLHAAECLLSLRKNQEAEEALMLALELAKDRTDLAEHIASVKSTLALTKDKK